MRLDHVAVLVPRIEETVTSWELPDTSSIEEFPQEGTRELYCGPEEASGRLPLMQPIGPGPYDRAMAKRGPGLHHIAFCVQDVPRFASTLEGSGWLLHPKSIELFVANRQLRLCRPGFPCLVEINEEAVAYDGLYISELSVSAPANLEPLIDSLGCRELRRGTEPAHSFVVGNVRYTIQELREDADR